MDRNVAAHAAGVIADGFDRYRERFDEVTRRAGRRFARRDWAGVQRDALNRLLLYGHEVGATIERLQPRLVVTGPGIGPALRAAYATWSGDRSDADIARTFFNSVVRRAFGVLGVDHTLEFARRDLDPATRGGVRLRGYAAEDGDVPVRRILSEAQLEADTNALAGEAELATRSIRKTLAPAGDVVGVDMLEPTFYRGKGAYLVGRVALASGEQRPLILALRHDDAVHLDAVLLTQDEASVVFGFTRSYFHVDVQAPRALVEFLVGIMPHKRVDELYTSLGFNRHGKAELYRAIMAHLSAERVRFEPAPGAAGLVMAVFTLPSLNVVFKVIRDRFGEPKRTTPEAVRQRYALIFTSDRVGRLADAQEFENLEFPRGCFSDQVLDELLRECAGTVRVEGDNVVIGHLYTERRVTPLNLFLRGAAPDAALEAMLDYGRAIRDLAAANIFPGDMLFKNFGVTRHGRVIFYDYDEVAHVTDCNFRRIPRAPSEDEEMSADTWFGVADDDVFPEEFPRFMVLPGPLGEAFRRAHGDLFAVEFWHEMQARHARGELIDFFPYPAERRLRPGG